MKAIKVVTVADPMTVPKIPKKVDMSKQDEPPPQVASVAGMTGMGGGSAGGVMGGVLGGFGSGPPVAPKPMPKPTIARISGGVIQGMAIDRPQPAYPPIAKQAHVSGDVVLHAIIGKDGRIKNLSVISGNAMLTQAALDGVANWRYKPYLLNGEPTEVDTTVTVKFGFGNNN